MELRSEECAQFEVEWEAVETVLPKVPLPFPELELSVSFMKRKSNSKSLRKSSEATSHRSADIVLEWLKKALGRLCPSKSGASRSPGNG